MSAKKKQSSIYMDEDYIKNLQKGSYSDFNKLYNLYVNRLYGFAYNLTHSSDMAEEIVQEVFLKVWQIREHISPDYSFHSPLFTIAKNNFLNSLRKQISSCSYDEYTAHFNSISYSENTTENDIAFKELNDKIIQAKEKLSHRQKEIFEMSKEKNLSNQEIASRLHISEQSVRNQLSCALKVLKEELIKIGLCFIFIYMNGPKY